LKKAILLTIISLLFFCCPLYAKDSAEIYINSKLKEFYIIANTPIDEKTHLLIDYAIEIIKYDLESINVYFVLNGLMNLNTDDKILIKKYNILKAKYFDKLSNLNDHFAEKFVLISLLSIGIDNKNDGMQENIDNKINNILDNSLETCNDKKKKAIINLLLTHDKRHSLYFADEFIKNYSHHQAIPFIKLQKLNAEKNDSTIYINAINEWIKSYGELKTPMGWKYKINALFDLANHYIEIKDYKTSKELFKKILIEAPNYLLGDQELTYKGFISGTVEIEINSGLDL